MTNDTQGGEVARLRAAKDRKQEEARRYRTAFMNIMEKTASFSVAHRIAAEAINAESQPTGRTDSERLDWLDENCAMARSRWNEDTSNVEWCVRDDLWADSFFAAIDAAIDSEKEAALSAMPLPPAPETK